MPGRHTKVSGKANPTDTTLIGGADWDAAFSAAIISETDPGAIGAGNLWLRIDPSHNYPPILYVRNAADDGWADTDGSGFVLGNGLASYTGANVDSALMLAGNEIEATLVSGAAHLSLQADTTISATGSITLDGDKANPGTNIVRVAAAGGADLLATGAITIASPTNVIVNASDVSVGADTLGLGGTQIGFFGSVGTTLPTVTGSRGGNAALASLLTALANLGLITNSSS